MVVPRVFHSTKFNLMHIAPWSEVYQKYNHFFNQMKGETFCLFKAYINVYMLSFKPTLQPSQLGL